MRSLPIDHGNLHLFPLTRSQLPSLTAYPSGWDEEMVTMITLISLALGSLELL